MEPCIVLAPAAADHALAGMMAQLLRSNLDERPAKKDLLARMSGRVAMVYEDLGQAVTLRFARGRVDVDAGIVGIPDVTIRAESELVLAMSRMELEPRTGLPDPRGEVTKQVLDATRAGSLEVHGLLPSLPLVARLTRLLSVTA
ncbi:MAG: SCP2 sterol-binding domain-containing protein [Myxococcota bacterium]